MLYQNIKAIADSKKISISEIERQCDITPKYIRTWDDVKPSYDKVLLVANFLGTTVENLVSVTPTQKE